MNQTQCNELRDLLFAARFPSGYKEAVFRYLTVELGGIANEDAAATIHYAYAPPVWERAGETSDAESFLMDRIAETPYLNERIALKYHDYLRDGWPMAWEHTAKASTNDFPLLVLRELADGKVTGVLMRNSHTGRTAEKVADAYVEHDEVTHILGELRYMPRNNRYFSWYKDSNIDAPSLEAAIAATPETDAQQKEILLYRGDEWLYGIWNNPEKKRFTEDLRLSSVADFHGTRVSAAKRKTRTGIEAVTQCQTIPGDTAVLLEALDLLQPNDLKTYSMNYEEAPAIKRLCAWWNAHAPEAMRHAAFCRAYIWSESESIFLPGDPEEPALQSTILAEEGSYAMFKHRGWPVVVLQFYRGQEFNKDTGGGTQTYLANNKEGMDIGLDIDEVDEAYYSLLGLQAVQDEWER